MARQQRFDWFLSNQRQRKLNSSQTKSQQIRSLQGQRAAHSRRPRFETLEIRNLLSVNAGVLFGETGFVETGFEETRIEESVPVASSTIEAVNRPEAMYATREAFELSKLEGPAEFNAFTPWDDLDPATDGIQITYSYSNFLDGNLPGGLTPDELRAATEEALGIWAAYAPLDFIEVADTGPVASDGGYDALDHPILRIGHHIIDGDSAVLAHAYFPSDSGLGGDVHFDNGDTWALSPAGSGIDVIEVMVHELGHALGLGHEEVATAIMNPFYGRHFGGPGSSFLFEDDIAGIQSLYGTGEGGVTPIGPLLVNSLADVDDIVSTMDPETMLMTHIDQTPEELTLREAMHFASISEGRRKVGFHEDIYSSTIVLDAQLGALIIDTDMIILGAGANITVEVSANDGFRIFEINNDKADDQTPDGEEASDTVAKVFISGLTLTGGKAAGLDEATGLNKSGGAIHSVEDLTLDGVTLHSNTAAGTGGAIYSAGPLSLISNTVENNQAGDDGGGVYAVGGATIFSSAFIDNHSGDAGGAIAIDGDGTDLVIMSSTLSGNTANGSGGAINMFDANPTKFRVLHSTVVGNRADFDSNGSGTGGGVYMRDGVLALEHSIVADNTDSGIAPDLDNLNFFTSPVILARFSLIGSVIEDMITQQDLNNLLNMAPMLQPLADNGGSTWSHLPQMGSPVLNNGNPLVQSPAGFDQRGLGFKRIEEDIIDIGAVESGGFSQTFTVDTLVDKNDITANGIDTSPEDTSFREAIALANLTLGPNRVNFEASMNGGTIDLSGSLGEILISDDLTIDADGLSAGLTINGSTLDPTPNQNNGDGARLFRVDDGELLNYIDAKFLGLSLLGGDVTGNGGAIHSVENLTLQQVSVLGNYATGDGGGIYHKPAEPTDPLQVGSKLFIENTTIANNIAGGSGGGLFSDNQQLTFEEDPELVPLVGQIFNSTISNNVAGVEAGGLFNFDGHLELRHVTVTANQAPNGSGIVSYAHGLTRTTIYSSIVAGNVVNVDGNTVTGFDVQDSLTAPGGTYESLGYNLIGQGNQMGEFQETGDQVGVLDPELQPLGNYGGQTMTHGLLATSPAIDAGDPNSVLAGNESLETDVIVANYDQRGTGYSRIAEGNADEDLRIDIGAVERQTPEPTGDFDSDGDTDGADFLAWQRGFGKANAEQTDGDGNADQKVDADDLTIWTEQYGQSTPAGMVVSVSSRITEITATEITTVDFASASVVETSNAYSPVASKLTSRVESTLDFAGLAAAGDSFRQDGIGRTKFVGEENSASELVSDRTLDTLAALAASSDTLSSRRSEKQQESQPASESLDSLDAVFEGLGQDDFLGL